MLRSTFRRVLVGAVCLMATSPIVAPSGAFAGYVTTIYVGPVTAPPPGQAGTPPAGKVTVVTPPPASGGSSSTESYTVHFGGKDTADQAASAIAGSIDGKGSFANTTVKAGDQNGLGTVTINGLNPDLKKQVCYDSGNSGTGTNKLTLTDPLTSAMIMFGGTNYDRIAADGSSAVFSAGIITNVGEFDAQVSASSLTDTSGSTIVAALFAMLAPQAASYGATINDSGNTLNLSFDPSFTSSIGGIEFGTTSLSADGATGCIELPSSVPEPTSFTLVIASLPAWALLAWRRRRDY